MAKPIKETSSPSSWPKYLNAAISVLSLPLLEHDFSITKDGVKNVPIKAKLDEKAAKEALKVIFGNALELASVDFSTERCKIIIQKNDIIIAVGPDGEKLKIGDIAKSSEKIGMGYVAEVIMQCAIVSCLEKRGTEVSSIDVADKIIDFVHPTPGKQNFSIGKWDTGKKTTTVSKRLVYSGIENYKSHHFDTIISEISCSQTVYQFIKSRKEDINSDPGLKNYISDSCKFVNKKSCLSISEWFYKNGKPDTLLVRSMGILGQPRPGMKKDSQEPVNDQTKADIKTFFYEGFKYSGTPPSPSEKTKEFDINNMKAVSLKIRGETQFGQVSGLDETAFINLAVSCGVKLIKGSDDLKEVRTLIPDKAAQSKDKAKKILDENTHLKVYKEFYDLLASKINNNSKSHFPDLAKEIKEFMSMNERDVTVVDIGNGLNIYAVDTLDGVVARLKNSDYKLIAEAKASTARGQKSGEGKGYSMTIYIGSNEPSNAIIRVESRYTSNRFANYVHSGPKLRSWLEFEKDIVK